MYEQENHSPAYNKALGKQVCVKCGLLYLNNYFTQWAIKAGCNCTEHPQYSQMRITLVEKWQEEKSK